MKPAQKHAVVSMRFSTCCIRFHVVDLAPASRNLAAGNETSTVSECDRPALPRGEAPLRRSERDDSPPRIELDGLGAAAADELFDRAHRDRRRHPVNETRTAPALEVIAAHAHEDRGRRPADRGHLATSCGSIDDRRENVMPSLVEASRILDRDLRAPTTDVATSDVPIIDVTSGDATTSDATTSDATTSDVANSDATGRDAASRDVTLRHKHRSSLGRKVRIEEAGELARNFGQQPAADRHETTVLRTEPESAPRERALLGRHETVRVERGAPHLRLYPRLVGSARH
jgi:hypothetical protein